jgi:hypothetical protein
MNLDLFGNLIDDSGEVQKVRIYADEIQEVQDMVTGERWLYTGAIYELVNRPILDALEHVRYRKDEKNWRDYKKQNDRQIHWNEIENNNDRKHIIKRWLDWLWQDCAEGKRKFYFSILGINLSNLNLDEFDDGQQFHSIYNRFFRSMLQYCLKKFFGHGVVVADIFHEEGPQSDHKYFDWHTILELDKDEALNFECDEVGFLPKNHRDDRRSNILQLCDVLLGIFKDLHLGVNKATYPANKKELLDHSFVQDLLVKRIIRNPNNPNSRYQYHNRFNISLFPKSSSGPGSYKRRQNNYYDIKNTGLSYFDENQQKLF